MEPDTHTLRGRPCGKRLKRSVALAVEVEGFAGEWIRGALVGKGGEFSEWDTPEALLAHFLTHRYRSAQMITHNLDYVFRYFLPALLAIADASYTTRVTCDGAGRVIWVRIEHAGGKWYMTDTYCLMSEPLEKLAPLAKRERDGTLVGDAAMTLAAYEAYSSMLVQMYGVSPSITAGSTALKAWVASLPLHHVYYRQRPKVVELAREAFYGGFTFVRTHAVLEDVSIVDVNAMYAHAMRQGVPALAGCHTGDEEVPGYPGIYKVKVFPPYDLPLHFVPHRTTHIDYPTTPFTTVLCSNLMDYARTHGYEFEVIDGYVWERLDPIFDDFLKQCEDLEIVLREHDLQIIVKSMRNPLAGKFGQKTTGKEYYLTREPEDDMTPYVTDDTEFLDGLYYRNVKIERASMMPHWAAWITSTARIMLVDTAYSVGVENVYYGHTDSLAIRSRLIPHPAIPLGQGYGKWKVAEEFRTFRVDSTGTYSGETTKGTFDSRTMGIPRNSLDPSQMHRMGIGDKLPIWYECLPRAMATVDSVKSYRIEREYVRV